MEINDWVSDKTKGRITGLIQPGALDQATALVLANAIYFRGRWAREFDNQR
jgi:serpin B